MSLLEVLLVVDVETGGLDSQYHSIIEIAAGIVEVYPGRLDMPDEDPIFHTKVKPDLPVNEEAAQVNHYTYQDWVEAPDIAEGLKQFFTWIRGHCAIYISLNDIKPMWTGCNPYFDLMFTKSDAKRHNVELPDGLHYRIVDVQSICLPLRWAGKIEGVGLKHLRAWAGCSGEQEHTAIDDMLDTCAVLDKMVQEGNYGQ